MNADFVQQLAAWILAPGGLITVATLLVRSALRSRQGKLTRAEIQTAEATRLGRTNTRLVDYIDVLRNQWPTGHDIPPWPRGLKPRE